MASQRKGKSSGPFAWYNKLAAFNVEDLFSRKRQPGPPRSIVVHQDLPSEYRTDKGKVKKEYIYPTNQVITSKYTIITFLPRNLLEQFRRIANIFFAGIAILQFFPLFSTISPGLVILPLLLVLGITACKDGYEDIKRHQSDRRVNSTVVRVLEGGEFVNHNVTGKKSRTFVRGLIPRSLRKKPQVVKYGDLEMQQHAAPPEGITDRGSPEETYDDGYEYDYSPDDLGGHAEHNRRNSFFRRRHHERHPRWHKVRWEDVKAGDFVKIYDDEPIPADIIICATSEEDNVAFVETKNLDGETNLKSRNACPELTHLHDARACADPTNSFRIDCEAPNHNMYRLTATATTTDGRYPIDLGQTLLRGTVLRHTRWIIGLVIYTGEDTKILLNSGGTPSKRSKVERQMNPQVFINLVLLAVMAVVCGVAESSLEKYYSSMGALWVYGDDISDDNPRINGLTTLVFALITFQNIVPISLYISIEFVRTAQAAFIYFDKNIFYEKTGQATVARSWNLSDDLGQIEYIFSDKTGTLTQNVMVFRKCSIGGKAYHGNSLEPILEGEPEKEGSRVDPISEVHLEVGSSDSTSTAVQDQQAGDRSTPSLLQAGRPKVNPETRFRDLDLLNDIELAVHAAHDQGSWARSLNGFFTVLSLCHTVLTTVDPETGVLQYKAQSPDEEALVDAAAAAGFVFRGRDRDILHLQTPFSDELERYQLVNILEFTSARKRMSVIVKKLDDGDDRLFLLTKGADNVIYERLMAGDPLKQVTEEHLDSFANEGLRTLTLAYKVIPQDRYDDWSVRYNDAVVALEDREEKIAAVSAEIECDLRLLGATAIEDRLQEGVPETIADLKTAGIKIWVATGDKLETAIAIGHSTNLISKDSNMIIVRGDGSRQVWNQMVNAMQEFFPEESDARGIISGADQQSPPAPEPAPDDAYPLRRVNTGVTSIVGSDNGERPGGFVLIIDGLALTDAFSDEAHKDLLLTLATQCEGVICCRVSPLQKALIVKLVKDGLGVMTLAIGDGANDVSMIQAAHVGVGISGEEGLQAVNSSDYAIAQFRFLKRLLLVHGHWSYARNGNMIVNFFYKNIVCIGVLWWFQIYCSWSSQYVFEYTFLLWWNSFWTIAPAIAIGLFDRIVDDDILMALPELYRYGREGHWFSMKLFVAYMLDGIMQSAIIFFIILYGYFVPTSRSDGYDVALYEFSTVMVISAVFVANCFNGLETNVWTGWVFFAVSIGNVLILLYTAVYNSISPGWFSTRVYGNNHFLWPSAYFWLCIVLTFCVSLAPRYLYKSYKFIFRPNDVDIMRWAKKVDPHRDFARDAHMGGHLSHLKPSRRSGVSSVMGSAAQSRTTFDGDRVEAPQLRTASRTDMSTGLRSTHRGFDFAVEEGGPAIRRLQSNLTGPRQSQTSLHHGLGATARQKISLASLRNPLKRRRPRTTSTEGHDRH